MISYTNDQIERLEYLLGKYKFDKLSIEEFNELKDIVTIWAPSVKSDEDIIKAGLITVGTYTLIKLFTLDTSV